MKDEQKLAGVSPGERVLLLSHCLRPSQACNARYNKQGLACIDDCVLDCVVGRLRRLALRLGYRGVCIAPGGQLALRFVKEMRPGGIVAIACDKELREGIAAVSEPAGFTAEPPPIVAVPLARDGCIDTEVDEERAAAIISLGCDDQPRGGPRLT